MSFLRNWRFPILIGSGLIAAAGLVYFETAHVRTDKTQGAIGKRDVYRDGQVNSADVAKPGTAPVAVKAILESSEFKELAKNPAFVTALQDGSLATALQSPLFVAALEERSASQDLNIRLTAALSANSQTAGLVNNVALNSLFREALFTRMASNMNFRSMVLSGSMQSALVQGYAGGGGRGGGK
jgi:hypothetical protein